MLAHPTQPSARSSAPSATPATRPCCTPTARCCRARRGQASWNYVMPSCTAAPTSVHLSYNMNRLQRLRHARDLRRHPQRRRAGRPGLVIDRMTYEHPVYTSDSVGAQAPAARAQRRHDRLRGRLPRLGLPRGRLPVRGATRRRAWACSGEPSVTGSRRGDAVRVEIVHVRADPGAPRSPTPQLPVVRRHRRPASRCRAGCAGWPASNPATTSVIPRRSLRANVDAYLAENGIDLRGGRVTMLANARAFGYVFNPLSLFWCHDLDGAVVVRRRRGAKHLRTGTSLPVACRRIGARGDRKTVLRLAVLPGRRLLPDERARAERATRDLGDPASRR